MSDCDSSSIYTYLNVCLSIYDVTVLCVSLSVCMCGCGCVVGMWRRNGSSTENVVFNYCRPILSKTFRLADLHAVQVASCAIGLDSVLVLAMDRFEIMGLFEQPNFFKQTGIDTAVLREYAGALLCEFLKFLSNFVSYVPTILSSEHEFHNFGSSGGGASSISSSSSVGKNNGESYEIEGLKLAVAREVVHHVLVGEQSRGDTSGAGASSSSSRGYATFSQLLRVKNIVGTPKHVDEQLVREVVAEYCVQRSTAADEEECSGYELNAKGSCVRVQGH